MAHRLFSTDGDTTITFYNPGDPTSYQIHNSHPNFDEVLQACLSEIETGVDAELDPSLFDPVQAISRIFKSLSERISVNSQGLYFDGDKIESSLSAHIIEAVASGNEDEANSWSQFMERLYTNPHEHARESLFEYLRREKFTITDDGKIVGYKSVISTDSEGQFLSVSRGTAFVDGEIYEGQQIPNHVGAIVTMPRASVDDNQYMNCSSGLHVGTHDYASTFSGDTILEIHFDPRDVVSVPRDGYCGKVRTCRYYVSGIIGTRGLTEKFEENVRPSTEPEEQKGIPSVQDWTDISSKAKSQKKSVKALALRKGWALTGTDSKIRSHWTVILP